MKDFTERFDPKYRNIDHSDYAPKYTHKEIREMFKSAKKECANDLDKSNAKEDKINIPLQTYLLSIENAINDLSSRQRIIERRLSDNIARTVGIMYQLDE